MKRRLFLIIVFAGLAAGVAAPAAEFERGILRVTFHEDDRAVAERSGAILGAALTEFEGRLPAGETPIHLIIAPTMDAFTAHAGRFSQVTVSGIAKPRQGLIVLKSPRLRALGADYAGTLRHELVHVLLFRNADADRVPKWLNEGTAMLLANEYRWASPFQVARMFVGRRIIEYRNLDLAFLAPGTEMAFGDAYAQALSMTRFLFNEVGEDAFWAVILGTKTLSFPDSLRENGGISPRVYWQRYRRSLWRVTAIGTMASGSLFTPAAFLLILAYLRQRRRNRRKLARWAVEEADGGRVFSWDVRHFER